MVFISDVAVQMATRWNQIPITRRKLTPFLPPLDDPIRYGLHRQVFAAFDEGGTLAQLAEYIGGRLGDISDGLSQAGGGEAELENAERQFIGTSSPVGKLAALNSAMQQIQARNFNDPDSISQGYEALLAARRDMKEELEMHSTPTDLEAKDETQVVNLRWQGDPFLTDTANFLTDQDAINAADERRLKSAAKKDVPRVKKGIEIVDLMLSVVEMLAKELKIELDIPPERQVGHHSPGS